MSYGEKRAVFVKADVTKAAEMEAAVGKCVDVFGRVGSNECIPNGCKSC